MEMLLLQENIKKKERKKEKNIHEGKNVTLYRIYSLSLYALFS